MKKINLRKFREKPPGLKIIIIIYSLAILLYLAMGIIALTNNQIIKSLPGFQSDSIIPESQIFLAISILFILLSVFALAVVIGLLKEQNWARTALIIFNLFNVIGSTISVIEKNYLSSINLGFNLIIASYLIFNKKIIKIYAPGSNKKTVENSSKKPGE